MKKLLFINSSLGNGGAERQMLKLIELLDTKGIHPCVLTYSDEQNDYPSTISINRINIKSKNKFIRNIKLLLALIKEHPSTILSYCGDPNLLALIYSILNKNCKVIVSERNLVQLPLSKRQRIMYALYSKANKIVSNSYSQAKRLTELYPKLEKKIVTITNYTEIPASIEMKNSQETSILTILICARYHPQKNIHRFLKAIAIMNQQGLKDKFKVIWHGQNSVDGIQTEYYRSCLTIKSNLGLDNVELLGYCKDIHQVLGKADIVCLPSLWEGFSNSISEGICYGKPVIASNVSDNPIFIEPGVNGYLFDPADENDIAEKLSKMIADKETLHKMGEESLKTAKQLFDSEKFVNSYIDILNLR